MTDLLSSVIAAHGGLDRWRTVRAIDVTFNFSGGLLDLKGYPGHRRPSASVDAATPRTLFQRLGDESDERWIFTPNLVWIERRDGTIVEERSDPRAAFAPLMAGTVMLAFALALVFALIVRPGKVGKAP
jgi:hypothetical protein